MISVGRAGRGCGPWGMGLKSCGSMGVCGCGGSSPGLFSWGRAVGWSVSDHDTRTPGCHDTPGWGGPECAAVFWPL